MQQNQQGQHFGSTTQQQPVYRFPQNHPVHGQQPQQSFFPESQMEEMKLTRRDRRALNRRHRNSHRILSWWNLFAVIGIITVMVQFARYIVIPLLVYLNVLAGGTL